MAGGCDSRLASLSKPARASSSRLRSGEPRRSYSCSRLNESVILSQLHHILMFHLKALWSEALDSWTLFSGGRGGANWESSLSICIRKSSSGNNLQCISVAESKPSRYVELWKWSWSDYPGGDTREYHHTSKALGAVHCNKERSYHHNSLCIRQFVHSPTGTPSNTSLIRSISYFYVCSQFIFIQPS